MAMFHIEHPARKTFLTWDELGCLCRALGFPKDLFKENFPSKDVFEIKFDEKGLSFKTIQRMFELNLMQKALHRTFNMHTADWNTCVITRAIYMLTHKVLNFEGVYNVRVAYMTYEHIDMKGMLINRHILLRTLKMCGRTIAPLKLMHRIKHMKTEFDEQGRIQLYEFFNLILWCDLYTAYQPQDSETTSGKEEDLYKLVDFNRLLSHYDERVAKKLNAEYLKEEWDFGMESLGPKEMFKEPPVYTETRIAQALYHKQNYRHLKHEVGQSQKRVYRAHAGSIRPRPISAPDLDKYRRHEEDHGPVDSSAHAAYESVQKRLHSAPSRASPRQKVTERPLTSEFVRVQTPTVVTPRDLDDVRRKMENLQFDINTLDSRCQLQVENEMEFYLPGYREKLANRKPVDPPLPEPERKQRHWTSKIINSLAYPPSNLKPAHAKNCDARYRGWRKVNILPGHHFVVTAHTHENSDKGRMFAKLEQTAMAPVQYWHSDYVVRYTPKRKVPTAVGVVAKKKAIKRQPVIRFRSLEPSQTMQDGDADQEEEHVGGVEKEKLKRDLEFFHNKYLSDEKSAVPESNTQPPVDTCPPGTVSHGRWKASGEKNSRPGALATKPMVDPVVTNSLAKPGSASAPRPREESRHDIHPEVHMKGHVDIDWPEDLPVPHMEHSGPKLIGVGHIGTISLLENIEESRDLEDKFVESPRKENLVDDVFDDETINAADDNEIDHGANDDNDNDHGANDDNDNDLRLNLRRHRNAGGRPSKSQPSSQQKRGLGVYRRRKSQSAPSARSGAGSGSTKSSPSGRKRLGAAPSSARATSSRRKTSDSTNTSNTVNHAASADISSSYDEACSSYVTTSCSNTFSSPDAVQKFKFFRGSVTSEESVKDEGGNPCVGNEDESSYSDEMTLPSSMGVNELPDSPPMMRKPVRVDLGDSLDSKRFSDLRLGPRIQFELLQDDLDRTLGSSSTDSFHVKDVRHSSISERKDSIKIITDYREYLSDSDIKKKTFSTEIRSRLVGRVENVISPDLKLRLMAGDPGVYVPAL